MQPHPQRSNYSFFTPLRVRWSEVDMQKVVFNGNYLNYVDIAITEFYRMLNLYDHNQHSAQGLELFVRKATLTYHASAGFDDVLDLGVRCIKIGTSSFTLEVGMFKGEELLVVGEVVYVYVDMALKKGTALPSSWIETFKKYH